MSKVVNLNKVRKARAKEADRKAADANAAKFGRTNAEKLRDRAEVETAKERLDDHKRE